MYSVSGGVSWLVGIESRNAMLRNRPNALESTKPHLAVGVLKDVEYLVIMNPELSSEACVPDDFFAVVFYESAAGN
jgi:hypothetical protein